MRAGDYAECYASAEASAAWRDLAAPAAPVFPWDPASTYLRPPPFVRADGGARLGRYRAAPLLVLGDDVTTDTLSPAGAIPVYSQPPRWPTPPGPAPPHLTLLPPPPRHW